MAEMWFELLAAWFGILVGFTVIIGVFFTFLRAVGAVRREDIADLKNDISKLDAKLDAAIKAINDKFDTYLFGEIAKKKKPPE